MTFCTLRDFIDRLYLGFAILVIILLVGLETLGYTLTKLLFNQEQRQMTKLSFWISTYEKYLQIFYNIP